MKKAAFKEELDILHAEFAKKLKALLERGETRVIGDTVIETGASAATLNVVRQFLKDNNITCDPGLPNRAVGELSKSMERLLDETAPEDLPKFTN